MSLIEKSLSLVKEHFYWGTTPNTNVFLFFKEGAEIIEDGILKDIEHNVLCVRQRPHPMTFSIAWRLVRQIAIAAMQYIFKHGLRGCLRSVLTDIELYYHMVLINWVKPAVAITFIDHSIPFHLLAQKCPNTKFIALQNGIRRADFATKMVEYFRQRDIDPVISCGYFMGQQTIDLYRENGLTVIDPYLFGSLKVEVFRAKGYVAKQSYDLCLVSHWKRQFYEKATSAEVSCYNTDRSGANEKLNGLLKRFIDETGASICIAMRNSDPAEVEYYQDAFENRAVLLQQEGSVYSSYAAVGQAEVCVGLYSTMMYEAMALGRKTLITNLTSDPMLDSPIHGLWSLQEPNYEEFRDRLNVLRAMTDDTYFTDARDFTDYVIKSNAKVSVLSAVRDEIFSLLAPLTDRTRIK